MTDNENEGFIRLNIYLLCINNNTEPLLRYTNAPP